MLNVITAALSRVSSALAAIVLVAMTAYTLIEIALRTLFGISSNVLVEFVGYGLAALAFLGAGQTMREGGLVRVNILVHRAPPRVRQALDAFCLLCGIGTVGLAAVYVWLDMVRAFSRDYETDSLVPLPAWVPPLGLMFGMAVFILDMVNHLILVVRGKHVLADESPDAI